MYTVMWYDQGLMLVFTCTYSGNSNEVFRFCFGHFIIIYGKKFPRYNGLILFFYTTGEVLVNSQIIEVCCLQLGFKSFNIANKLLDNFFVLYLLCYMHGVIKIKFFSLRLSLKTNINTLFATYISHTLVIKMCVKKIKTKNYLDFFFFRYNFRNFTISMKCFFLLLLLLFTMISSGIPK